MPGMSGFSAEMIGQFDQIGVAEAFGDPAHDSCRAITLFEVSHRLKKQMPVHSMYAW
jgi:hypothetical protein